MTSRELDMMYGEIDAYMEDRAMSGTEWTEPGQGATLRQLFAAPIACAVSRKAILLHQIDGTRNFCKRTNLRLTGEPLTAEDIQRIAEAK